MLLSYTVVCMRACGYAVLIFPVCVLAYLSMCMCMGERERQCVYITLFPEGDRISLNVTIVFQCINSINAC